MSMAPQITEEQTKESNEYKMPEIRIGAPVLFYPYHNLKHPFLGFVVSVTSSRRNVSIRTTNGHVHDGARHVTDPKLTWNADHRENGSWDYTDENKALEKERQEILARLDALEYTATKSTASKKKTKDS